MYSRLSLEESQIMAAVRPLLTEHAAPFECANSDEPEPNTADLLDAFASIAWSTISEPGDAIAGIATMALGATKALVALREDLESHSHGKVLFRAISDANPNLELAGKKSLADRLPEAVERWRARFVLNNVLKEIALAERLGARVVCGSTPGWPQGLDELGAHRPQLLWLLGDVNRLSSLSRCVAFVGARSSTGYGERVTQELVAALASKSFATISGGAFGIDSAAHLASIAADATTVAVMAGGLAQLYPAGNAALFKQIAQSGLIVSELPPSREPTKWRFLQRNRLIAAASQATVVVEAGWRSGSTSTANHAASLGRLVAAIPGDISRQESRGANKLIRDRKAELIGSAEDLIELIDSLELAPVTRQTDFGPLEVRLLDALTYRPKSLDRLCSETGMSLREVAVAANSLKNQGLAQFELGAWRKLNP